jgi:uncharacterized protein
MEEAVGGGFPGWLVNTLASALIGLVVGAVVVLVIAGIRKVRTPKADSPASAH